MIFNVKYKVNIFEFSYALFSTDNPPRMKAFEVLSSEGKMLHSKLETSSFPNVTNLLEAIRNDIISIKSSPIQVKNSLKSVDASQKYSNFLPLVISIIVVILCVYWRSQSYD